MRAGLVVSAVVAVLVSGCVTGRELRVQAELHAPVVPQPVTRRLEPSAGYLLANPLVCFQGSQGCGGGGGYGGLACLVLVVGCVGVVSTVDLVALPVQAVRRNGQNRDLALIDRSCPLEDPAARAAQCLAARMVEEFGFSPGPKVDRDTMEAAAGARRAARDPVYVRVSTTRFERSSKIAWEGEVQFLGAEDKVLWRSTCEAEAPAREASTFLEECAVAREEVASLADQCVAEVAGGLRRRWPEWDPARTPPRGTGPSEATAGWDR